MAFFNLTHLGVQEPIRSALKETSSDNPPNVLSTQKESSASSSDVTKKQENLSTSNFNSEAQGSYVKYTERLTKHQRTQYDPNEIYGKPITSSQDYGWWKQDGAPQSLPWTKVQRSARVNSEMTRFVDEMTLTNKHFTLF